MYVSCEFKDYFNFYCYAFHNILDIEYEIGTNLIKIRSRHLLPRFLHCSDSLCRGATKEKKGTK